MNTLYDISDLVLARIAERLSEKGLSAADLAGKIDMFTKDVELILNGERALSLEELSSMAVALDVPPYWFFLKSGNILDRWDMSIAELQDLLDNNPSMRGFVVGYLAESKVRTLLEKDLRISNAHKYDDHDRNKKSDLVVTYMGKEVSFEVKSLQTNTVRTSSTPGIEMEATFQCDASDRRTITLADGQQVETTCLRYGDFDIIAINLFAFHGKWEYAFALNHNLPHSNSNKYPKEIRDQLIKSSIKITWPLQEPFVSDPFLLLDELIALEGK